MYCDQRFSRRAGLSSSAGGTTALGGTGAASTVSCVSLGGGEKSRRGTEVEGTGQSSYTTGPSEEAPDELVQRIGDGLSAIPTLLGDTLYVDKSSCVFGESRARASALVATVLLGDGSTPASLAAWLCGRCSRTGATSWTRLGRGAEMGGPVGARGEGGAVSASEGAKLDAASDRSGQDERGASRAVIRTS